MGAVDNLFSEDLTNVTPSDLAEAIRKLAASGVEEKLRLDFKEKWDADKQIPDIVAFANSYGGLLVLGVSDDRQRFPGTPDLQRLKKPRALHGFHGFLVFV
jgi:predicted HTH transcriptional regulator